MPLLTDHEIHLSSSTSGKGNAETSCPFGSTRSTSCQEKSISLSKSENASGDCKTRRTNTCDYFKYRDANSQSTSVVDSGASCAEKSEYVSYGYEHDNPLRKPYYAFDVKLCCNSSNEVDDFIQRGLEKIRLETSRREKQSKKMSCQAGGSPMCDFPTSHPRAEDELTAEMQSKFHNKVDEELAHTTDELCDDETDYPDDAQGMEQSLNGKHCGALTKLETESCFNDLCADNNNCAGETNRCLSFPRSVDVLPQINNLPELVEELHRIFADDRVNVDYVNYVMRSYKSNHSEWRKYAKFDKYKYTRNLVDAGNDKFNLMILCWGEGHGSSVHDHANAHCFMKMLDGTLTETRYDWPHATQDDEVDNGVRPLQVISKAQLATNEVCYINDSLGLHRVENSSYSDKAVSLHLYSPPFNACSVFNERTGHKSISKVTFWSKFGKKENPLDPEIQKNVLEDN